MPTLLERAKHFMFGTSGYDAVDPKNRRKAPTGLLRSEDGETTQADRDKLVSGHRDTHRNFSLLAWMIRRHLDYVTTFAFRPKTGNKELDKRLRELVREKGKRANFDVAGRHGLHRSLRLAELRRTVDHDVLAVRQNDGRIQWIEGDRIRVGQDPPASVDVSKITRGVLTNDAGKALAYAVCRRGRVGLLNTDTNFIFEKMVPAQNAYLHAYYDRFDQVRGVSPLAAAINEFRDSYEFLDLARAKMKISQLFALALYRDVVDDEKPSDRLSEDGDGYEVDLGKGPLKIELRPGDKADFLESKTPSAETQQFCELVIQIALKSLDIPYSFFNESFTNYSGSRGALLQYERSTQSKRAENIDLLDWYTSWRLIMCLVDGELPGADPNALINAWEWHAAGVPWLDPLKEILAMKEEVAMGVNSRTRILRERNIEFDDVVDELEYESNRLADAGLPLSADPDNALIAAIVGAPEHATAAA